MASDHEPDDDHDPDLDREDDGGESAVTTTQAAGALAALTKLTTALDKVIASGVGGRTTALPMLQFKREGDGTWSYGQKKIVVEAKSRWAFNPTTFHWGYVALSNNALLGENMVPITKELPDVTTLKDVGTNWQLQFAVNAKCLSGADTGVEVVYKATTKGGISAINEMIAEIRDRLTGGQHGNKIVPIAELEKDSYMHKEKGRVWIPIINIVEWTTLGDPPPLAKEPIPTAPSSTASEPQPRRRRVA